VGVLPGINQDGLENKMDCGSTYIGKHHLLSLEFQNSIDGHFPVEVSVGNSLGRINIIRIIFPFTWLSALFKQFGNKMFLWKNNNIEPIKSIKLLDKLDVRNLHYS
jgi:hypothetical protein